MSDTMLDRLLRFILVDCLRRPYGSYVTASHKLENLGTFVKNKTNPDVGIFVSYAREDKAIAEQLVADIKHSLFLDVWFDSYIHIGSSWRKTIDRALASSRLVIVLWSRSSVHKHEVIKEARFAHAEDKIIPVRVEDVQLSEEFDRLQYLDVFYEDGKFLEHQYRRLLDVILQRFPDKNWNTIWGNGSVQPRFELPEDAVHASSFTKAYVENRPIAVVYREDEYSIFFALLTNLRVLGFTVEQASSSGEYNGEWHRDFSAAINRSKMLLVPWLPSLRAARLPWPTIMDLRGDRKIVHLALSKTRIDDIQRTLHSRGVDCSDHLFLSHHARTFALTGDHLTQTWEFVHALMDEPLP